MLRRRLALAHYRVTHLFEGNSLGFYLHKRISSGWAWVGSELLQSGVKRIAVYTRMLWVLFLGG